MEIANIDVIKEEDDDGVETITLTRTPVAGTNATFDGESHQWGIAESSLARTARAVHQMSAKNAITKLRGMSTSSKSRTATR